MESIGAILKQEREKRGLSLEEAHDATKITPQNLSALEEDRFDYFPNRVYARAFLRDYANFLGLDSAELLTQYEEQWNPQLEVETAVTAPRKSVWKPIGYTLLVIVLLGGIGTAGYIQLNTHKSVRHHVVSRSVRHEEEKTADAPAQPKTTPAAESASNPAETLKPQQPVVPDKLTLNVATFDEVWVLVKVDEKTAFIGNMAKGKSMSFDAKSVVFIRAGKAGAVQLKINGKLQPSLGPLGTPGEKTFKLSDVVSTPASTESAAPAAASSIPASNDGH